MRKSWWEKRLCSACALCGKKRKGRDYRFHYGEELSRSSEQVNDGISLYAVETTIRYRMAGEDRVHICQKCIWRQMTRRWWSEGSGSFILPCLIIGGIGAAVFAVLWHYFEDFMRSGATEFTEQIAFLLILAPAILAGFCLIGVVLCCGAFLMDVLDLLVGDLGTILAIEIKREEYKSMGYDALLTPRQRRKLKAELPSWAKKN